MKHLSTILLGTVIIAVSWWLARSAADKLPVSSGFANAVRAVAMAE